VTKFLLYWTEFQGYYEVKYIMYY